MEKWLDLNLGTEKGIYTRTMGHLVISERKRSLQTGYDDGRGRAPVGETEICTAKSITRIISNIINHLCSNADIDEQLDD